MASVDVYCVCGQPYDPNLFMIQCDVCKDWFHGNCIDVKEHDACDIIKYHCPQCQLTFGPSIWKQRTNWHRHDYSDPDASDKPVQTGTYVFIKELKSRHFESAESIVTRLNGEQFNLQYLLHSGFTNPVLVTKKDGLGLVMPPEDLTVSDVMDFIGPDFMLDVIDVRKQEDLKMTMSEWVDYFNSYDRSKVFNVISLEFSDTRLSDFVKPPSLVQRITPENSFTDFHIDFGGSSVWYHVLRGEKLFYLIRPTQTNLSLYEHWMASANQSETFFGDQADACYRLTLTAGQTLFIPTGWIHAVYTSVDSMVFGGKLSAQLQHWPPATYKFPSFETTHWFAASYVIEQLRSATASEFKPPGFLIVGAKALMTALKNWTQEPNCKLDVIPSGINVPKLLKDMAKEVRAAEKKMSGKVKAEKETKKGKQGAAKGGQGGGCCSRCRCAGKRDAARARRNRPQHHHPVTPLHKESVYDFNDSDDDGLVVDENPPPQPRRSYQRAVAVPPRLPCHLSPRSATTLPWATLRQRQRQPRLAPRLPPSWSPPDSKQVNGKSKVEKKPAVNSKAGGAAVVPKSASGEDTADVPKNGTIDDLLLASSIALDTDSTRVSLEEELGGGRASPSTRDAIQGMLSMSKSAFTFGPCDGGGPMGPTAQELLEGGPLTLLPPGCGLVRKKISKNLSSRSATRTTTMYTLDWKPRMTSFACSNLEGDQSEMKPGIPKPNLLQTAPNPPRPTREGTQKKSVKRTIEDTASKLANKPPPKRSYHRKKSQAPSKVKEKDVEEFEPGPSTSSAASKKPSLPPDAFRLKKPKKGFATAKQRLGKILKIHKMIY
ncbi:hypothetical protein MTO96_006412 [Rhipicephalus appendiculatus]